MQDWIDSQSLTQKRTCNILTPLRQIMAKARKDEAIKRDPLHDFKVEKRQEIDALRKLEIEDVDPFEPTEIEAIVAELHPQATNYVQAAVWTGLRPEELIEVKWSDVDFRRGILSVRRARTRGQVKQPKTSAGKRSVKLLEPARAALEAQKAHTLMFRGYVFHDPRTAEPYATDKQFREWQWRPALVRAKVRYRPPRQLRHTYATWLISAGENIKWVSGQVGHASTKMTLDTYANWLPSLDSEAGNVAVAKLWSGCGQGSAASG